MLILLILVIFGILIGISSALFGFGGGFMIVPLIYHLSGINNKYNMYIAIATSTSIIIINAINSTYNHYKKQHIILSIIFPLVVYIAIGAILGIYISQFLNSTIIRIIFIIYIIFTIYECLFKKHFINNHNLTIKPLNKYLNILFGIIIGLISTILGLGGSILTVPLMRRMGIKMKNAIAMASPLSFPIGLIGSIGYFILAYSKKINLGTDYLGFIYLPAFFLLLIGGLIGVPIGLKLINKIPDKLHAKIYIILLFIVLIMMILPAHR